MSQLPMDALPLRLFIPYTFRIWILLGLSRCNCLYSLLDSTSLPHSRPHSTSLSPQYVLTLLLHLNRVL